MITSGTVFPLASSMFFVIVHFNHFFSSILLSHTSGGDTVLFVTLNDSVLGSVESSYTISLTLGYDSTLFRNVARSVFISENSQLVMSALIWSIAPVGATTSFNSIGVAGYSSMVFDQRFSAGYCMLSPFLSVIVCGHPIELLVSALLVGSNFV